MSEDLSAYEDADSIARLEANNRKLIDALAKANTRAADLGAAVRDAIEQCLPLLNHDQPPIATPPKDRRRKGNEHAIHWFSDWQFEKVTRTYNRDVCEERIHRYLDTSLEIVDIQRQDHPVRHGHVWLTGDMIEGEDIFPSQVHLIGAGNFRQLFTCARLLTDAIIRLEENYETLEVWAVCGNHGWLGGGPRRGRNPETNFDRILYNIVAQNLRERGSKARFHIPDPVNERSWYLVAEAGNYRCLLIHGDQVKGQLGFPWYGFGKKVQGWANGAIPEKFTDVAAGHWHQAASFPLNFITVRVSGSPESDNQYAQENLAAAGRPSQWLLFAHPEKGEITAEYRVWLDQPGMQPVPVIAGPWEMP